MNRSFRSGLTLPIVLGIALSLPGCARIKDRQGYLMDPVLVASVQPGVDTRESVQGTLGRPSFAGQFDDKDWYYVSRDTRQLAFAKPVPSAQLIVHVRFDDAGNVVSVDRTGLEQIASIELMATETPTLGRDRGFFQELFGNVGAAAGTGRTAGTADNPQ